MFYLKTEHEGKPIEVEIYGDEIYTKCTNCGKEIQIDAEFLIHILQEGDLSSTSIACCNNDRPTLTLIK